MANPTSLLYFVPMKPLFFVLLVVAFMAACSTTQPPAADAAAFEPVRTVLETNCVHCHGKNHFKEMPAITSTRALAGLIGPGKWIVPGKPEQSRFFQVVTFPDEVWGAMPPTGHAISKSEARVLRAWILAGAKVPAGNLTLSPRGELPRSR